jgi:ACT domain-containing protein
MRAIITVIGKDQVGIVAKISNICAKYNANILDINQTLLQEIFTMVMLIDIEKLTDELGTLKDELVKMGEEIELQIHVMHEDIFNSMHRI